MNAHLASALAASHVRELRRAADRRRELTGYAPLDRAASNMAGHEPRPAPPLRRRLGFTLVEVGLRLLAG